MIVLAGCAPAIQHEQTPAAFYTVQVGDQLAIRHLGDHAYDVVVTVAPDGSVAVPGVPEPVGAAGQTVAALRGRLIRQLQASGTFDEPALSVSVQSFADQEAFIGGEVRRPGLLALPAGGRTLLQAVMAGGGPLPSADLHAVAIVRTEADGSMRLLRTDLGRVLDGSDLAQNLTLRPLDVIIVPRSGVSSLDVWVDQYVRQALPIPVRVLLELIRRPLPPL